VDEQGVRGSSGSSSVVRFLAFGVFIVIASLTTTGFVLTRRASHDQEPVLKERSGEVAVLLSSSTNNLQSTLGLLGEVYVGGRDESAFAAAAGSLIKSAVTGVGVPRSTATTSSFEPYRAPARSTVTSS
jgi:hypothetical protein